MPPEQINDDPTDENKESEKERKRWQSTPHPLTPSSRSGFDSRPRTVSFGGGGGGDECCWGSMDGVPTGGRGRTTRKREMCRSSKCRRSEIHAQTRSRRVSVVIPLCAFHEGSVSHDIHGHWTTDVVVRLESGRPAEARRPRPSPPIDGVWELIRRSDRRA